MVKVLNTWDIKTVGQLRKVLEDIPDTALLNIGTEKYGYTVNQVGYDGMSVAIMTKEVGDFEEENEGEENHD